MDNLYKKGELLQLQTKDNEVIEGRFYGLNNDKSRISLYSVKEQAQGIKNEGVCHYYGSEVCNIVKLKDEEEHINNETKYLKISEKECKDVIKASKMSLFVNQVDNSYHAALEDLKQYSYIAVSTDGAAMGRNCKLPFLVLSTPHQTYIFDIQVMQFHAFDGGLKELLESKSTTKIIHDSRKLSDCLYHKHNVKLSSVFDTQVGDIIITKNKTGRLPTKVRTLQECLNSYLGLPLSTIEDKFDLVTCNERPLSSQLKDVLAKNIGYLHRLSESIQEQIMLPFMRGVEYYVKHLRNADDYKAWELCGKLAQVPKEFKSVIDY